MDDMSDVFYIILMLNVPTLSLVNLIRGIYKILCLNEIISHVLIRILIKKTSMLLLFFISLIWFGE